MQEGDRPSTDDGIPALRKQRSTASCHDWRSENTARRLRSCTCWLGFSQYARTQIMAANIVVVT